MEIKTYLKPVRVDYLCDDCNTPIQSRGGVTDSRGSKWEHICPNCAKIYFNFGYGVYYPHIIYQDLDSKPTKIKRPRDLEK